MLKSRRPVALIVLLWLLLLAIPLARANFCVQAWESGVAFTPVYSSDFYDSDDDGDSAERLACSTLPDPATLARAYPDDREVQFGLAVASDNHRDFRVSTAPPSGPDVNESKALDALIARYPSEPALIAAKLECTCAGLVVGRWDNPVIDPNWPKPIPYLNQLPVTSPAKEWNLFLALAERGGRLEPGNAFFDIMRMDALLALHRDDEAFSLLGIASRKSDFNDHMSDQDKAVLVAFGCARALTPMEQIQLWRRIKTGFYSRLVELQCCVSAHVGELRSQGQGQGALAIAVELLRLGRLVRQNADRLEGSGRGVSVEDMAIGYVYLPPLVAGWRHFTPLIPTKPPPLNVTTNLAGYARAMGRPDITREVLAEWSVLQKRRSPAVVSILDWNENPALPLAEVANLQEHWGRLLLRTIPLCLLLLGLCDIAERRFRLEGMFAASEPPVATRSWRGALIGSIVLLFLAIGDALVAWQGSTDDAGNHLWPYSDRVAGLSAVMPPLVLGSVGATFVLLSFARSRRWQMRKTPRTPWLSQVKAALRSTSSLLSLDWTPLVRLIAGATMWSVLAFIYAVACWGGPPDSNRGGLSATAIAWALTVFPWFVLLVAALMRLNRLQERRRALAVTALNLRELCRSYIVLALLLYPVTVLLITAVDMRFNRIHSTFVNNGQTATILGELGL